ncbi:MAG: phosphoribosylformylglycinamidine synthase subunit PurL [Terriglobales bacterium]
MPFPPDVLARHGVTAEEFAKIVQLLGREPNLTELGIFSVMWSEHCSYKSSRVHLKNLPTEGPRVLQGPGENAGIIDIGDGWACAFKIESHNHPSYVEPFQGAATGVGGILRDIFTMGARPIAIMDSLRFGDPHQGTERERARTHAVIQGVVGGVAHYGNCFGVANVGGETRFDPCYAGNPLVNAFALGIARHDGLFFGKATGLGNPVIYVGSKTGRDGIHGATMASEEFSEASEAKRPNVQVGDPFLEKLLLEACLEAMQTGAIVGIQDMGAAGLTCSSCEMGGRAATGIDLDLDAVPQRETGMTAYEMMLSESQERMLLVAERGREEEVFAVFRKWGLDAVTVGAVTDTSRLRVTHRGSLVADIPNSALTDEAPIYRRPVGELKRIEPLQPPVDLTNRLAGRDWNADLLALLASPNLASKHWVYEQYDTMVRTNTLEAPGGDAGVVRIKGTNKALAMALDGNGRYCRLEPREGARLAVAEAARNVACVGAVPAAATNCLNFGNPEKPEIMAQLVAAIAGIREACTVLETPITGGNVSLYNETLGQGIDPTPVLGVVGILELAPGVPVVSSRWKAAGRPILLVSGAPQLSLEEAAQRFGSSEFATTVLGQCWGLPPALDLAREKALHQFLAAAVAQGWLESAHDVSEGGLAVCLVECALSRAIQAADGPAFGAQIEVAQGPAVTLFDETASRVVLSCLPEHVAALSALGRQYNLEVMRLGETGGERLTVRVNGATALDLSLTALDAAWSPALEQQLEGVPV